MYCIVLYIKRLYHIIWYQIVEYQIQQHCQISNYCLMNRNHIVWSRIDLYHISLYNILSFCVIFYYIIFDHIVPYVVVQHCIESSRVRFSGLIKYQIVALWIKIILYCIMWTPEVYTPRKFCHLTLDVMSMLKVTKIVL